MGLGLDGRLHQRRLARRSALSKLRPGDHSAGSDGCPCCVQHSRIWERHGVGGKRRVLADKLPAGQCSHGAPGLRRVVGQRGHTFNDGELRLDADPRRQPHWPLGPPRDDLCAEQIQQGRHRRLWDWHQPRPVWPSRLDLLLQCQLLLQKGPSSLRHGGSSGPSGTHRPSHAHSRCPTRLHGRRHNGRLGCEHNDPPSELSRSGHRRTARGRSGVHRRTGHDRPVLLRWRSRVRTHEDPSHGFPRWAAV
mmetsp:Transcript_18552/g.53489  ORF Transcript_18552/g.53489 Transcript_18552/m.53489 type:complete len:249 (-) Transcript_18552:1406-2152(-)